MAAASSMRLLVVSASPRFALTRLADWLNVPPGALVQPKDPAEYIGKLRFHQRVAGAGELGVA